MTNFARLYADEAHKKKVLLEVLSERDAEIRALRNKLNADSQAFQIECHQAEIAMLRERLAEAEALLRDIYSYAEDQGMETLMDIIDTSAAPDSASEEGEK